MQGGEGVAVVLIALGLGTLIDASLTLRAVRHPGRRLSLAAVMAPTVGWVVFYLALLFDWLNLLQLRDFSRWLVVGLFAAVNLQSWAMRRTENGRS